MELIGDFFQIKDLNELYNKYLGKYYHDIKNINNDIDISEYISCLKNEEYHKLFM